MLLINLLVVLVVVGLLLYVVEQLLPLDPTVKLIIRVVIILAVCLWLLRAFGLVRAAYGQDITVCQPGCEPGMKIAVCNLRVRNVPLAPPTPDDYVRCIDLQVPTAGPVTPGVPTPTPTVDPTCGAGACRIKVPDTLVQPGWLRNLVGWAFFDFWSDHGNTLARTPTPGLPPSLRN